jgi:predicted DNA-binding transcriptional regulator AlpA
MSTLRCIVCRVTHHLVGVKEVAEKLGVTTARVVQIANAYEDFPAPVARLASGRVWRTQDVERWMSRHEDRRPGRPPRSS